MLRVQVAANVLALVERTQVAELQDLLLAALVGDETHVRAGKIVLVAAAVLVDAAAAAAAAATTSCSDNNAFACHDDLLGAERVVDTPSVCVVDHVRLEPRQARQRRHHHHHIGHGRGHVGLVASTLLRLGSLVHAAIQIGRLADRVREVGDRRRRRRPWLSGREACQRVRVARICLHHE